MFYIQRVCFCLLASYLLLLYHQKPLRLCSCCQHTSGSSLLIGHISLWSQVCLHCFDIPVSSTSSSRVIALIPLEAALLCELCHYYHLSSIITSLDVCLRCTIQACIMLSKPEWVSRARARERAWMGEPEQGRYIPELTNYCMWVIKKH